jgi:hypothetical protein
MKCERRDRDRAEAPLTIDQELQLGDQLGEPSWFLDLAKHVFQVHGIGAQYDGSA